MNIYLKYDKTPLPHFKKNVFQLFFTDLFLRQYSNILLINHVIEEKALIQYAVHGFGKLFFKNMNKRVKMQKLLS